MVEIIRISSTWPPASEVYKNKIIIYNDNWNDYGYHTLFHMLFCDERGKVCEIGSLKIYNRACL